MRAVCFKAALPFCKKATTAGRRCSLRMFSPSVMRLVESPDALEVGTGAQLDVRSFHSLLEAQAKSRQGGCGKRALDILRTWENSSASSTLSSKHEKREITVKNPDLRSSLELLRNWEEKNALENQAPQGPDLQSFILAVQALSNDPNISLEQRVAQTQELYERAKSYIIMMKQQLTDPSESSSSWSCGKEQLYKLQLTLLDYYVIGVPEDVSYAQRAEALLAEMEDETGTASSFAYNRVLQAWKLVAAHHSLKCPEAILRARALLDRMAKRSLSNCISYSTYIAALANQRSTKSAEEANVILDTMNQMYTSTGNVAFKANAQTVSSVMSAWVHCGQPQRAQQLLDRMEADYLRENHKKSSGADIVAPNDFSYNIVMDGWAKSGRKDAAKKTQQVFERMQQMYQQGNVHARPNIVSYRTFLGACAKANNAEFAQSAEDVFLRIYNEYQQGDTSLELNRKIMTMVISAWVRCRQPERAQQLLDRMELDSSNSGVMAPDAYTYTIVMDGWAKSGRKDSAKKTQQVFERMQQMYQQGNVHARPNIVSYRTLLNACAKADNAEFAQTAEDVFLRIYKEYRQGGHSLKLDTQTLNNVLLAWVRCGQPERAQQLLARMEKDSSNSTVMALDAFSYNIVMDGWAKSGRKDAAKKTQQVFECMQQVYQQGNVHARPDVFSYTILLGACAKANNAEFAQTAEDVFLRIYEEYQQGDHSLKLNTQIMNMVISAWMRCRQPQRAQQLLDRMELDSSNSGVMAPDVFSYNMVMNGWAKSGRKDSAKKTQQVFERMQQMYQQGNVIARPDCVCYRTLLNACAKADSAEFAQTAEDALFQMHKQYKQGDLSFKPKERTVFAVSTAWLRCGQPQRAEQLLDRMEEFVRSKQTKLTIDESRGVDEKNV